MPTLNWIGEAYQTFLIDESPSEVTPALTFTFDPHAYPIHRRYHKIA